VPQPAVPRIEELAAPSHWRTVDFISDIHLQPAEPATFEAWRRYLGGTPADAVFILGDLFEAWPGDDAAEQPGFAAECAAVLRAAAQGRDVLFMHGNRDFLVGTALAASTGIRLLNDPTVLAFGAHRWLLTHGDALCLDDTEYLAFRAQVRAPAWQQAFLARPLAEREAVARALRDQSEARKRSGTSDYTDVDTDAALAWLHAAQAPVLLHGHTHRPGEHRLDDTRRRIVLSDWDAAAQPARLQVLRLERGGAQRVDLS
jgi:UDP-2,3-diacylglucosamine hydrolase